nr:MAG TPA: hypothetical protein [Caudoviricetes sp.]
MYSNLGIVQTRLNNEVSISNYVPWSYILVSLSPFLSIIS